MVRGRYGVLSAAAALAGLVLILLAELADLGWGRVFGAGLISLGGIGLGVLLGLDRPRRDRGLTWLRDRRVAIGVVAAVILVLPVVAALAAALVGLVAALGDGLNDAVVAGGGAIALLMLAGVLGAFAIAARAIRRAARAPAESAGAGNGEEAS